MALAVEGDRLGNMFVPAVCMVVHNNRLDRTVGYKLTGISFWRYTASSELKYKYPLYTHSGTVAMLVFVSAELFNHIGLAIAGGIA